MRGAPHARDSPGIAALTGGGAGPQASAGFGRRTSSIVSLQRLDTSHHGGDSVSPTSSSSPNSQDSPRGLSFDRPTSRRGNSGSTALTGWLIVLLLGFLTLFLSVMVYNTARIGFRSISTTSYVNVNYWPMPVGYGLDHAVSVGRGAPQLRPNGDTAGSKLVRLALGKSPHQVSPEPGFVNAPRIRAESWPPDTPDWEACSARDAPDRVRSSGSVFGYFSMYLRCPAAPKYAPSVQFSAPAVQPSPPVESPNATAPELLIGVFSSCQSRDRRDIVRRTWARLRHSTDADVRVVFVVARDCDREVKEEAAEFRDVVFVDVRESYFTLTPKAQALLRYGLDQGAQYILKTDDDSFIFIDRVIDELRRIRKLQAPLPDGKQPCLYWGRRCSIPLLNDFNNPRLRLFQTSVSKWYYPPHYLRHFEGTAYMCGAAYLLSASLAAEVLKTDESHHLAIEAPFLPEDASVGHLVGPSGWERCSCQDHRYISDVRRYHGRNLFAPDVDDCKRADILSRTLAVHGLKTSHMDMIMNYDKPTPQSECSFTSEPRCFSPCYHRSDEFSSRDMSKPFDEFLWQEVLLPLQPQFPEINWQKRLEMPSTKPPLDSGMVPMLSVLKAQHTPWCVRHTWAIQIAELMADLNQRNLLECNLGMGDIYIDATSMQVKLNEESDTLVGYSNSNTFSGGIPCYADNMCDRCFLFESREGLFGNLCDPKTWTCKGYKDWHQSIVVSRKILFPLVGRFMHDTPDPQEKYRRAIDEALHISVSNTNGDPLRIQAKLLRSLYEAFNGQECTSRWHKGLADAGETEVLIEQA